MSAGSRERGASGPAKAVGGEGAIGGGANGTAGTGGAADPGATSGGVEAGAAACLERWLGNRLSAESRRWLDERLETLRGANSPRELHIAFGLVPRKLGRAELAPTPQEMTEAEAARTGWDPSEWTVETAARALVLCRVAERDPEGFGERFADLCRGADLSEQMTLQRAVPLLPPSDALDAEVAEGLRTNMRAVFEAIAHRSPYPRERFDANRWNHMVLKALFVDSALAPIQGLDERANEELARILCDYAHERWAAGRPVTPELWRCVGPFARGAMVDDLARAADTGSAEERDAAVLALAACPDPAAAEVLERHADAARRVTDGTLTWDALITDTAAPLSPEPRS